MDEYGPRHTPIVKAIEAAVPAVVYIQGNKTVSSDPSLLSENGKPQVFSGMGTGVIIDPRGYIVTNNHVVADVARIEVTLGDGTTCIAKNLAADAKTDLALIKVDVDKPLPVISIGSSRDLMLGETVIAIGNPFGYQRTVTVGIVSGLHRNTPVNGSQDYRDLIQTSADINPGNSGGPLVNIEGDMIGINVAVRMGAQGIGFAIPVDAAIEVASNLVASSHRNSVSTGLQLRNVSGESSRKVEVLSASGAAAAQDLEAGDIIVAVDGREVQSKLDFELALIGRKVGEHLPIKIQRGPSALVKQIALANSHSANRLASRETPDVWEQLGLRVSEVGASALRNNQDRYKGGLKVTAVRPGSPAAQQKIQVGDIVVGAIGWKTPTLDDLHWVLNSSEYQKSTSANLFILRGSEEWIGTLSRNQRNIR